MGTTDVKKEIDGAQLVVQKAFELAAAAGLEISRIWFQDPLQVGNQEGQVLAIAAGGRTARVFLTEKALRDFATGYGADITLAKLRAFCRFYNKSCEELIGMKWQPQVHPDDLPIVEERLSRITPEHPIAVVENRVISGDSTVRWMQFVNRGFFDQESRLVEIQAVGRDITELKRTQVTLREYSRRLINLEEELRKNLSRELHDDIGQQLTALDFNLAYLDKHVAKAITGKGAKLRSALDDSRLLTKTIQRSMRNLMMDLRPVQLDELGLGGAIISYANQFGKRTGIATRVQIDSPLPRLSTKAEVALFRIAQEALTNAAKYAQAGAVRILLELDGDLLRLSVIDNGIGFELQEASRHPQGTGWGQTIMRERAEMAGGRLMLSSQPGAGTSVVVEVKVAA